MSSSTRVFALLFPTVLWACVSDQGQYDNNGAGPHGGTAGVGVAGSPAQGGMENAGSSGDAGQEAQPQTPGTMRVVSWNCLNLFDDRSNNCGDYCPFEEVLSSNEYKAKIAGIARGLKRLNGDIVFLQEVENKDVLGALATHPDLADMGYDTRELQFGNDPRGINIGLLSRIPIDAYISHKDDKFTRIDNPAYVYHFARDAVEVHFTYRGQKVGIVGVHFKARIDDDLDRRVAEAQQARAIADAMLAADPERYVFIVGDFNDEPGTDTYLSVRDGQNGQVYKHALRSVPTSNRYTYKYGSTKLLLDHLMASPNASDRLDSSSATILHDKSLPSDHAPIAATYTVP